MKFAEQPAFAPPFGLEHVQYQGPEPVTLEAVPLEQRFVAGGQHGHIGTTLKQVADPDQIKDIKLDRSTLPPGSYRVTGYETRQVVDIDISTFVTEWRAEVIEHQNGKRYVAEFPKDVTRPAQYGIGVKSNAVYLSQYQLIPYNRVEEQFQDQMGIPISIGTINNMADYTLSATPIISGNGKKL